MMIICMFEKRKNEIRKRKGREEMILMLSR
jgi:hypothetical protein